MEKKENAQPDGQVKEKSAAAKPEQIAKPAVPSKIQGPQADKPHRIKITQMSLQEVEEAIEKARQHMGGTHSQYAQALLSRREFLSQHASTFQRKAA